MRNSGVVACALLAGCAVFASARPMSAQMQEQIGIARGSTPEVVQLADLDGNLVNLTGRLPVLMEFWATWCENCEALLPRMIDAHGRYGDQITFLAVAVGVGQNPRSIRRHLRRHPMPYPVVFDERGAAVRAYMTPATSYIVIVDETGTVVYTGIGRDQDIDAAIRSVID